MVVFTRTSEPQIRSFSGELAGTMTPRSFWCTGTSGMMHLPSTECCSVSKTRISWAEETAMKRAPFGPNVIAVGNPSLKRGTTHSWANWSREYKCISPRRSEAARNSGDASSISTGVLCCWWWAITVPVAASQNSKPESMSPMASKEELKNSRLRARAARICGLTGSRDTSISFRAKEKSRVPAWSEIAKNWASMESAELSTMSPALPRVTSASFKGDGRIPLMASTGPFTLLEGGTASGD
mmetsp:Transcript_23063/g.50751  ORF Transcript_23063/g.50751 Transcript_23063/m.50751 type:complete len:241 (+) Transcript_23063:468-1190(+)